MLLQKAVDAQSPPMLWGTWVGLWRRNPSQRGVYRAMSFGLGKAQGGLELGKSFGKYLNTLVCYVLS